MRAISKQSSFAHGIRQNLRVIAALATREMTTRYGQKPMGYLWGFAEPAAMIGVYLALHTFTAHAAGDAALLFMITGIMTFRMSRGISGKMQGAISSNQALLTFPNVKPLDTILARALIEAALWLTISLIFFSAISWYLDKRIIVHKDEFAVAMLATLYFSFCLGAFNAVISILVPIYSSIWSMLGLPLLMASGIMYVAAEMPPAILNIIIWNPFLHCIEWVRIASYLDYHTVLDKEYLLTVSSVLLTTALILERMYRPKLISE